MVGKTDLLGAIVTVVYCASMIALFLLRLAGRPQWGRRLGLAQTVAAIPLVGYLLVTAPRFERPALYYLQAGLMLAFLLIELTIDYLFRVAFRQVRWMVIAYVMLFFAGTGGMLGITAYAGRPWVVSAGILYLVMGVLAFVQRKVTGM